jgi:hypothetical protein
MGLYNRILSFLKIRKQEEKYSSNVIKRHGELGVVLAPVQGHQGLQGLQMLNGMERTSIPMLKARYGGIGGYIDSLQTRNDKVKNPHKLEGDIFINTYEWDTHIIGKRFDFPKHGWRCWNKHYNEEFPIWVNTQKQIDSDTMDKLKKIERLKMDDFHNIRNVEVADLSHQSYLHDVDNFSKKMLESLKIPKERLGQSQITYYNG